MTVAAHTAPSARNFAGLSTTMLALGLVAVGFGVADVAMVSPAGVGAVAAVGLGDTVVVAVSAFFFGLIDTFSARLAAAEGAGSTATRLPELAGAFLLGTIPLVAIGVGCAIAAGPFLGLIGQPEEIVPGASGYIATRMLGVLPTLLYLGGMETLKVCGLRSSAIVLLVVGLVLNVGGNALFLWSPASALFAGPEVAVATATVLAQSVMFVVAVVLLLRGFRGQRFRAPSARAVFGETADVCRVGAGVGIRQVNDYAASTVPFLFLGHLGVGVVAAAAVAAKIWTLYCRVPQACFGGAFVLYGYASGRSRSDSRTVLRRVTAYSAVPVLVATIAVPLLAPWLVRLIGGDAIDAGMTTLFVLAYMITALPYFFEKLAGELLTVERAGVVLSVASSVVTYGLTIPLAALAVYVIGSPFLAIASAAIASAVLAVVFWRRLLRAVRTPEQQDTGRSGAGPGAPADAPAGTGAEGAHLAGS
ncbi:MATE family efflux transporter [Curtobacterium sp. L3-7]|uniref:MATE family efflux transporter n=1 Tax=Curtobacterium sp. L3-7 TaxID=3138787 RepID=UPI003B526B9E